MRKSVFGGSIDISGEPNLDGFRVLALEDDYFLGADAEMALASAGAEVVGPLSSEGLAIEAASRGGLSAAVVDINLGYGPSFETAYALREAGIPFVFVTGYDESTIAQAFANVPRA